MKKNNKRPGQSNRLRVIGGEWKGRKVSFVDAQGLRPTPDRVRETLFNWLQHYTYQSRCLDMFAGSGALGLEALSRGAAEVVFIEKQRSAAQKLKDNLQLLSGNADDLHNCATVLQADAIQCLSQFDTPFDIIFLDPPFRRNFLPQAVQLIQEHQLLTENGLLYVEYESDQAGVTENQMCLQQGFEAWKQTKAGQVISQLYRKR